MNVKAFAASIISASLALSPATSHAQEVPEVMVVDDVTSAPDTPVEESAHDADVESQCSVVDIVIAAGTGEANSYDDPSDIYGLNNGTNFVANIVNKFEGDVTAWQVPYTASVGVLASFGKTRADRALPYGASKNIGIERASAHIADVKANCPDTKFIVVGFSQGATVSGDVTEMILNGEIPHVTEADLAGAYLIADPGRSALTGNVAITEGGVSGLESENGEILIPLDQSIPDAAKVGLTGARSQGAFAKGQGRVLSFCHNNDLACSTENNGLAQQVGEAMNNLTYSPIHDLAGSGFHNTKPGTLMFSILALLQEIDMVKSISQSYTGDAPVYSGANLAGTGGTFVSFITPLLGAFLPAHVVNVIPHALNMMQHHVGYFTDNSEVSPWTIGGVAVDQWIEDDMTQVVETHI